MGLQLTVCCLDANTGTCKTDAGAKSTRKATVEPTPASMIVLPWELEGHAADEAAACRHQAGRRA